MSDFYSDYSSLDFAETLNKKEFKPYKKNYQYQEPNQMLLRNWISKPTLYENVLLFNQLGTGKTCTSIMIAEGFKEYINNMGNKIIVLVKNKNIERNFLNELLSKCTNNTYLSDDERKLYFSSNTTLNITNQIKKKELVNKVHRTINKQYVFYKYQSFVNRILGPKIKGTNTRKQPSEAITDLNNTVIIVDEAHNVTNNDIYTALKTVLSKSYNYRLVLLTATPLRDNPKDIFELSNLLNINTPQLQLPIRDILLKDKTLVERKQSEYINQNIFKEGIIYITDKGKEKLQNSIQGKVSFLLANTQTNPISNHKGDQLIKDRNGTTNVIYCQMSQYQYHVYKKAVQIDTNTKIANTDLKDLNLIDSVDAIEAEEDILDNVEQNRKSSAVYKNVRDASTMVYPDEMFGKDGFLKIFKKVSGKYQLAEQYSQVLTNKLSEYSSKLYNLLQNVNSSPGNVFIFSNYVSWGGTSLIKQLLLYNGYYEYTSRPTTQREYKSFIVFDDNTKPELREKYRRIFNSPENKKGALIKIIIGSPIISEGITLKNVRQVHIMEPSWNMSRINQIIGRAVRNYSHHDLEQQERTVDIYKYISVYEKPSTSDFFIDKEMYILAEEKDRSNKIVERLLKQISFDCAPLQKRNKLPPSAKSGDAICDYQECDYKCTIQPQSDKIYRNTYNLYLTQFDHHDIKYVLNALQHLFKTYFIWNLEDIITQIKQREPNISNEVIFTVLDTIVNKKIEFNDMYNREGYIINNGPYYIFNSSDIDINSSLYSKIMDFSTFKNKYTFDEFSNNTFQDKDITKIKKQVKEQPKVQLSDEDTLYNNQIIDNNTIYGSYVSKIGIFDGLFRIIDRSGETKSSDKRKIPSGMAITSYTKNKLEALIKKLDINVQLYTRMETSTTNLDNTTLQNIVEKYFLDKKIMLKPHKSK